MKTSFLLLLLLGVFSAFFTLQHARASQNAQISAATANIYLSPATNSEILQTLTLGQEIRISNFHKDGWYRVRTSDGKLGWINNTAVALEKGSSMVKAANLDMAAQHRARVERKVNRIAIRPSLASYTYSVVDVGGYRNTYAYTLGMHADFTYMFDNRWRFVTRTGYYVTPKASNKFFSTYRYGIPLQIGLEAEFHRTRDFVFGGLLISGVDFSTVRLEPVGGKENPSSTSAIRADILTSLSFLVKSRLFSSTFFVGEIGGYFSPTTTTGIADVPFMNNAGNPKEVTKKFSGAYISLGAEFAL